jgi:hypothetical protein
VIPDKKQTNEEQKQASENPFRIANRIQKKYDSDSANPDIDMSKANPDDYKIPE